MIGLCCKHICVYNINVMERTIVHADLDSFFVSCSVRENPALAGIPLVVGGGSERGVVAAASYEARRYGVRSAMSIRQALILCPNLMMIKGDYELYSRLSKEVTEIIEEQSPTTEKASIDEFYLDISGMDKYLGSSYKWTHELIQKVTKETGLPMSFGLSLNKTVAKMATNEAKPKGEMQVGKDEIKPFLYPLPILKIPGLGQQTFESLSRIGIRKVQNLAEMPEEVMVQMLGKNGSTLWRKANGIDNSLVIPFVERKSISTEQTFQTDTTDIKDLKTIIIGMVEKLCFQLRTERRLAATVTLKIRYSNFDTETKQQSINYTAQDHDVTRVVLELFETLYHRRMLLRLIGVSLSGLVSGAHQINMFSDTEQRIALYDSMDWIRRKYGKHSISIAAGINGRI